jgi:predicted phosphoribosyltransferase
MQPFFQRAGTRFTGMSHASCLIVWNARGPRIYLRRVQMRFRSREHAAQLLAEELLAECKDESPLILGIPRGAVPMAKTIADRLHGDLDVVLVHKLGHPHQPEFAIGAIDESGKVYLADWASELPAGVLEQEKRRQLGILRRRRAQYTPLHPPVDPSGRVVVVVDDGIATGSTMMAALRAARAHNPKKLICATAVASPESARSIAREADALVCLMTPADFAAVGQFFEEFEQVTDEDVIAILRQSRTRPLDSPPECG